MLELFKYKCRIELINEGYDPFIDFLKGICIFLVILKHALPASWEFALYFPLWGDAAVPIFLLIQAFHFFKRPNWGGAVLFGKGLE